MVKVVPPKEKEKKKKVKIEKVETITTKESRDIVTGWEGLDDSPMPKLGPPSKEPSLLSPPQKKESSAMKMTGMSLSSMSDFAPNLSPPKPTIKNEVLLEQPPPKKIKMTK